MGNNSTGPAENMRTADNAKAQLLQEDRRRLLKHVIHVFQSHGGRLQLPIGMAVAEPWLLDSVDVAALLRALSAAGASKPAAPIDLLLYCQRGARTVTSDNNAHSRGSSRRTSDTAGCEAPRLQLPQLHTGLSDAEEKDLAFLVLACNCPHEADLLDSVRSQLDIDEVRASEVQRLLGLVASAMRQQAGPLAVSKSWTANLELPLSMLGVVLPRDFSRFRSFVTWRDTLSNVLLATLAQSVKEGWCQEALQPQRQQRVAAGAQQLQLQPQGSGGGTAQQLMARLKAALRRLDVRDADEFDEEEYRAASEAVRQQTQAIVQCVPAGWAFPWGLRVRLYEMLLRALFDSLDEAEYVPDKERYLQVLETHIRPLLGIAPAMHSAVFAWVHFRQYVITQAPQLLVETRGLLYKLAAIAADTGPAGRQEAGAALAAAAAALGAGAAAAAGSQRAAGSAAAAGAANGSTDGGYRKQDAAFARNVGQAVVDWILERLSDYHSRLDALGGPESIPGLVDLLAFASSCRGASEEEVGRALLESVSLSTAAELQRRMDAAAAAADAADYAGDQCSEAGRCADVCRMVKQLIAEETRWTRGFASQLPEAYPVLLAVLQEAAGAVLMPWLSTQPVLDDSTCEALRCALDLEPRLMGPIRSAAAGSCRYACTARLFASVRPWNMPGQLQPLLSAWLDKQMSGFVVWVDRQLQQEDWKPLGLDQFHSASARELRRIAMESLEALFGLQLPLPASTVRQYMQGIAGMMTRYLDAILTVLGSEAVMIPPVPPLTRYKRDVAVKQEEAESQLPGMPSEQPPPGAVSRKGVRFADSVRRVEDEPCASRVGGLTTPVLVVMLASLAYLAQTLQLLATSVKQMRQQEQQARLSGSGSPVLLDPLEGFSSGTVAGPEVNPFLLDADNLGGSFWDPGDRGGTRGSSSSAGGVGSSSSPAWGSRKPPLQQQQQQLAGTRWQASGCSSDGAGVGSMGPGPPLGGGSSGGRDEQFGSLHETGQRLRVGLAAVARWLAVRVVWWQQRSGWFELLYRHRVTSQRVGWLLDGLADTLQDNVSALAPGPEDPPSQQTAAQELYSSVALELLQQAAKAMERTLLDGGPCRWFIPADVEHLADDVEELKKLFFRAKVPMQDIRTALLGLEGVLRLMRQQTGPLIEAHKRARRAALLAGPAAPASPPPPSSSSSTSSAAAAAAAGAFSVPGWGQGSAAAGSGSSSYHTRSPSQAASAVTTSAASSSSALPPTLGPLAAAKLANAAQGSPTAAGAAGRASDRGSGGGGGFLVGPHHSRQPTGGSTSGSTFDDAALYGSAGGGGGSPSWAASKVVSSGAASPAAAGAGAAGAAGAAGVLGGIGCMRRTAQDVAATGGDVEAQEPILLRVLCHRADHAASKYLKETMKVPKVRDEGSVKETLKRGVTRFNPF